MAHEEVIACHGNNGFEPRVRSAAVLTRVPQGAELVTMEEDVP